jgi:hypothetical protein
VRRVGQFVRAGAAPEVDLTQLVASHRRVVSSVSGLTDAEMRQPSRLPEWSRDLLAAHLRIENALSQLSPQGRELARL